MAAINLDKLTLKELNELNNAVAKALNSARDRERAELKGKIEAMAASHGFSVGDLFGGVGGGRGRGKSGSVAKYANPDDRSQTWTGRGRKPNWLAARLKKGAKIDDFAI